MERPSAKIRATILLISLLSLALVSWVDYLTGYELLFFVFYFVPVGLSGWYLGRWGALAMAGLSGVGTFVADRLSGHNYSQVALQYWNSLICSGAFAILGLVLQRLRAALEAQYQIQQQLRHALEDLSRSTEEIRKLQSGLQAVCAWTKRIRVNGQWMEFDKFLAEKLHLSLTHSVSPEALEQIRRELGSSQQDDQDLES